ncbi:hypothetical protein [Amycolatopsis cihanbeyliensis]|uniref:Uncharacterized protein n=1 Tax=Amycolatopsis cihanbeyliensis TaxID=1128664 RepID=A0A542DMV2_AMYCI|nr:hypothetical protein [Amycolatopsis cihanbeyliensis]TQJ04409.1 hypothetical protein FB471_4202 [Amycolatopsis cihanbeyliensis]
MHTLSLSPHSRRIAGILLLSLVGVEFGGLFMARVVTGGVPTTEFQQSFFRAGHAHAGMLVTLGLVGLLMADAARLHGRVGILARTGIPAAAILMPAGFFFSAMGSGVTGPNGLIVLLFLGGASLAAGVVTLGIGLLRGRSPAKPVEAPPAARDSLVT